MMKIEIFHKQKLTVVLLILNESRGHKFTKENILALYEKATLLYSVNSS